MNCRATSGCKRAQPIENFEITLLTRRLLLSVFDVIPNFGRSALLKTIALSPLVSKTMFGYGFGSAIIRILTDGFLENLRLKSVISIPATLVSERLGCPPNR
jgi:hypothetical protein